jgi:hypothetical protein
VNVTVREEAKGLIGRAGATFGRISCGFRLYA